MDPSINRARYAAKSNVLSNSMPPPPAYHLVVDPNAPIPNMRSPYDPEYDESETAADDDDDGDYLPEVNINATTQVRGHSNIISTPQMDARSIATMIYGLVHGLPVTPAQTQAQTQTPASGAQGAPATEAPQADSAASASRRLLKPFPKINITINCGATVVGDRNIVGPGLGEIAKHYNSMPRSVPQSATQGIPQQPQPQNRGPVQPSQPLAPLMSRTVGDERMNPTAGVKRNAEDDAEGCPEVKKPNSREI